MSTEAETYTMELHKVSGLVPETVNLLSLWQPVCLPRNCVMKQPGADHGFYLVPSPQPGDKVDRPSGDWLVQKDRFLLGRGPGSPMTVRFAVQDVGIPTEQEAYVVPMGFSTFTSGVQYFHGGLSLQECVVPVVKVGTKAVPARKKPKLGVDIRYRRINVTSRSVMIEIACHGESLPLGTTTDWGEEMLEIQLVILKAGTEDVVGRISPNDRMDSTTGWIRIGAGEVLKVPLLLNEDFNGTFVVKAMDPNTMAQLAQLSLTATLLE
jgi:hypothetical protein